MDLAARQALPDHRRGQRHRPRHGDRGRPRGAELALTDIHAEALERAAAEIRGGRPVLTHAADISDYDAVRASRRRSTRPHGSMDVVMNVAGISTWGTVDSSSMSTGAG